MKIKIFWCVKSLPESQCKMQESVPWILKAAEKLSCRKRYKTAPLPGSGAPPRSACRGCSGICQDSKGSKRIKQPDCKGKMEKIYLAVTCEKPQAKQGILEDYLKKDGKTNTSSVVSARYARSKKSVTFL